MKTCVPSALFCLLCALTLSARADITIRLSVKAVLNPATGMRQPGVMDANFANCVTEMNAMLASFGRGYRFQWVGNALLNVGGLNQFNTGPSRYYDVDFVNDANGDALKDQFELNAIVNATTFGWDPSAINIYITRFGGANWNVCSFPGHHIILINGVSGYTNSSTVLHEIGHYFNLSHTFSGRQNLDLDFTSCTNGCGCPLLIPGGIDGCDDTIADHDCWDSQNDIAMGNYGLSYASLNTSQTAKVDNMWWNLMSYHGRQHVVDRFTPDQLDRWSDSANDDRGAVRNGRTRFVATTGSDTIGNGGSVLRYRTLARGVAVVNDSDDVVLLRGGSYNETMTISKALTLRATRGTVVIGSP